MLQFKPWGFPFFPSQTAQSNNRMNIVRTTPCTTTVNLHLISKPAKQATATSVIPPAFRATGGLEIVTSTLPLSLPSPRAQHPSSYNALARGFEYAQVIAMIDCHVMVMIGIIDRSTLAYKKKKKPSALDRAQTKTTFKKHVSFCFVCDLNLNFAFLFFNYS